MSINGTLTRTDDGAYTGWIADLTFDVIVTLIDNTFKTKDSHPDYAVMGKAQHRELAIGLLDAHQQSHIVKKDAETRADLNLHADRGEIRSALGQDLGLRRESRAPQRRFCQREDMGQFLRPAQPELPRGQAQAPEKDWLWAAVHEIWCVEAFRIVPDLPIVLKPAALSHRPAQDIVDLWAIEACPRTPARATSSRTKAWARGAVWLGARVSRSSRLHPSAAARRFAVSTLGIFRRRRRSLR